jgi:hypothetical protein
MEEDARKTLQRDWASDRYHCGAGLGCWKGIRSKELPSSGSVIDSGTSFRHQFDAS